MGHAILESPSAETRIVRAAAWLAERSESRVVIIGTTLEATAEVARRALHLTRRKAALGWERTTLGIHAASLARLEFARLGLVPVSGVAFEALAARVLHDELAHLTRLEPIRDKPGLPRALARTIHELRLAGSPPLPDRDLSHLCAAFERALEVGGFADRARMFELATAKAFSIEPAALVLVDVSLRTRVERDFVAALAKRAPATFAAVPAGDSRTLVLLHSALNMATSELHTPSPTTALSRLQQGLFGKERAHSSDATDPVSVLSAPGESRECVEIARVVLAEAEAGTPFDRIAVLLRAPQYGPHLEEAFRRARIPAWFARGTQRPDPGGRALLALLSCAAEGLSALRFAEYLSLSEIPAPMTDGAPPPPTASTECVVAPEDDAFIGVLGKSGFEAPSAEDRPEQPPLDGEADRQTAYGTLPTPRHWEQLLVDAAVIGGKDRWVRRLDGLRRKLEHDKAAYEKDDDLARTARTERELAALDTLRRFALPLIEDLIALPQTASWGEWIDVLAKLATRAVKNPDRILGVLRELAPMSTVGDVELGEVRLVLERRLSQLVVPPTGRRYGKVFVATIEEARGLSFDVVCVPGLAEKVFPQKVAEDPLLLDNTRLSLGLDLATMKERTDEERLALRLAVGAASRRVVFSYSRLDVEQARPRTPSFYGLEVLRVAEGGELQGFEHLAQRAAAQANARLGWPAPLLPENAVDEAEYDLAVLDSIRGKADEESTGAAHYLLNANEHVARALRFRARRWLKAWKQCDGLVDPPPEALAAIHEHTLDRRAFSPTALQHYSACPYRFLLSAIHTLQPRDEPARIEDLDPLTRGSLVHDLQFELLTEMRDQGMLPVTDENVHAANCLLDATLKRVATRYYEDLAPAIDRVWDDALQDLAADVREWLHRMTQTRDWTPAFFELSFGLGNARIDDKHSQKAPLDLSVGIRFRGSLDLVERDADGALRAVDYKTGKVKAKENVVIGGGEILQPALYALALENSFPGRRIDSGVLYYCTNAADFTSRRVPLDQDTRDAARAVAHTVGTALREGFLPAAPAKDACRYCDYRSVCGPHEEVRTKRKPPGRLKALLDLRKSR